MDNREHISFIAFHCLQQAANNPADHPITPEFLREIADAMEAINTSIAESGYDNEEADQAFGPMNDDWSHRFERVIHPNGIEGDPDGGDGRELYIISDGSGPLKIGHSNRATGRVPRLQTGNPRILTVIHTVTGLDSASAVERRVHGILAGRRVRPDGEWFDVTLEEALRAIEMARYCQQRVNAEFNLILEGA
jgi:hypothetical protein